MGVFLHLLDLDEETLSPPPAKRTRLIKDDVETRYEIEKRRRIQHFQKTYEATNKIRYSELCTLMRLLGPRLQCDEKMASVRLRNKVRPITLEEKIQMTLRYLAGDRVLAIMDTYGASKSFVYSTIDTVMEAIINHPDLKIRFPHTEEERRIVKEDFQYKSYCGIIRGCLGAIDGWLCLINTPRTDEVLGGNVESYFSGHYQTYGINVQAAVDAHCRFIAVSIRCPGSTSDSQAWMDWGLRREIDSFKVGEYLVGDNAYPCSDQLLTPFNKVEKGTDESRDAFNFYLSQTRIRVEMAFGYLTNKFQFFKRPLTCPLKKTTVIVLAAMTIHNFYITERLKNTAGYQIPFSYPDVVHARKVPYTVNGKRKHKIVTSTEITCDTRVSANKTPTYFSGAWHRWNHPDFDLPLTILPEFSTTENCSSLRAAMVRMINDAGLKRPQPGNRT